MTSRRPVTLVAAQAAGPTAGRGVHLATPIQLHRCHFESHIARRRNWRRLRGRRRRQPAAARRPCMRFHARQLKRRCTHPLGLDSSCEPASRPASTLSVRTAARPAGRRRPASLPPIRLSIGEPQHPTPELIRHALVAASRRTLGLSGDRRPRSLARGDGRAGSGGATGCRSSTPRRRCCRSTARAKRCSRSRRQ